MRWCRDTFSMDEPMRYEMMIPMSGIRCGAMEIDGRVEGWDESGLDLFLKA
jgi:hypothetical protein